MQATICIKCARKIRATKNDQSCLYACSTQIIFSRLVQICCRIRVILMSFKFSEGDIEEMIARHPEIIERGLTLKGRQVTFRGKRVDLILTDRFGDTLIVELKKGVIRREHIGQLAEYLGHVGEGEEGRIRIMLIGSVIPQYLRRGMERLGIEFREMANRDYTEFLRVKDPELLEELKNRRLALIPEKKLEKPQRINSLKTGGQRFWLFQANPKRYRIFDWWDAMKRRDYWRINNRYRDKITKMGIDPILVTKVGEYDVWSIDMRHHEGLTSEDLHATLLSEKYDYWSIFQHKNEVHKGDMAAIWVAGRDDVAGIYAITEIVTNPFEDTLHKDRGLTYWAKEEDRELAPVTPRLLVSIRYVKMLFNSPILRASIRDDPILSGLKILRFAQATNFPVTHEQWKKIRKLAGPA